jgi:integrase/recombinase XerD
MIETAGQGKTVGPRAAQRYQAGLVIALLAARPLRIRNYQTITIGESLRWDGRTYWLSFNAEDTKTGGPIDKPVPADLIPGLDAFLRYWRPILVRQAKREFGTAVWPHLFRDCLLTSLATDQPDQMSISPTLLGHVGSDTGQKYYNHARMLDAGKRFAANVSELREGFLDPD